MTKQKWNVPTELPRNATQCSWVRHWLPGYLRHELTAVQLQQFQAHLAQCNTCAQHVQEARLLDADLQTEADRFQPRLSREASLHIQNQVYRRMQRSLVWQRTGQILRLGTAVAALILLLMGSFVFGRFWLPTLTAETAPPGETTSTMPALPPPGPTAAAPTPPQIAPTPEPTRPAPRELSASTPANGRLNAWDHWVSAAPGQSPEQLAATIVSAALANDEFFLTRLFVGMGAAQEPTARMWLSVSGRCQHQLTSNDFRFTRHPIPLKNIATVSIWHKNILVGEIKMRQVQGEWFATFTRTPGFNPCLPS